MLQCCDRRDAPRVVPALHASGAPRESSTLAPPFSGKKTELLEGGLRIPAIISWSGRVPAGRASEQVTANMDWLPTLLAAAGKVPDPAYLPDGTNRCPI